MSRDSGIMRGRHAPRSCSFCLVPHAENARALVSAHCQYPDVPCDLHVRVRVSMYLELSSLVERRFLISTCQRLVRLDQLPQRTTKMKRSRH
jgi:hypothetical protein